MQKHNIRGAMKKLWKSVYYLIPFKNELFSTVKKIVRVPQSIYKHLHFEGDFLVRVREGKSFKMVHYGYEIENELFWKGFAGGWEKVSLSLWARLCEDASVILDIGANTGVYCLTAKAVKPEAKVFAFEPVETVYQKLVKNCLINNFNIACYPQAVSNYNGRAKIYYDTTVGHVLSVTVNKNTYDAEQSVQEVEVPTITLKQFIEDINPGKIDLIKIDVETHEPEVLEGFGEYLNLYQPSMLIEVLSDEIGESINKLVCDLDYLYFNIDENSGVRLVDKIGHSDYYNYLLCTRTIADKLNLIKQ